MSWRRWGECSPSTDWVEWGGWWSGVVERMKGGWSDCGTKGLRNWGVVGRCSADAPPTAVLLVLPRHFPPPPSVTASHQWTTTALPCSPSPTVPTALSRQRGHTPIPYSSCLITPLSLQPHLHLPASSPLHRSHRHCLSSSSDRGTVSLLYWPRMFKASSSLLFFLLLCCCSLQSCVSQLTWSYCYAVVGYTSGVNYTTSVSGTITTLSSPVTVNSRTAYNVTGMNGTRVYSDSASQSSTSSITGVYDLSGRGVEVNFTAVDQLLFSTWPFFDSNGLLYTFSGTAQTPNGPVVGQPVVRLWVDSVNPAYSELIARTRFNEAILHNDAVAPYDSTGGDLIVLSDGGSAATAGNIAGQCLSTSGQSSTYSFCYFAEQEPSTSSTTSWSILSYGTIQATGPVNRRGRSAVIAHSASGQRTVNSSVNSSTTSFTSSIVGVRGLDQDELSGYLYNDNAMYLTSPYLDDEGLVFILSSQAVYPLNVTIPTTDVQIYRGDVQMWYDEITPFVLVGGAFVYGYASVNSSFFQYSTTLSPDTLAAAKCQGATTSPTTSGADGRHEGISKDIRGYWMWIGIGLIGWSIAGL